MFLDNEGRLHCDSDVRPRSILAIFLKNINGRSFLILKMILFQGEQVIVGITVDNFSE